MRVLVRYRAPGVEGGDASVGAKTEDDEVEPRAVCRRRGGDGSGTDELADGVLVGVGSGLAGHTMGDRDDVGRGDWNLPCGLSKSGEDKKGIRWEWAVIRQTKRNNIKGISPS